LTADTTYWVRVTNTINGVTNSTDSGDATVTVDASTNGSLDTTVTAIGGGGGRYVPDPHAVPENGAGGSASFTGASSSASDLTEHLTVRGGPPVSHGSPDNRIGSGGGATLTDHAEAGGDLDVTASLLGVAGANGGSSGAAKADAHRLVDCVLLLEPVVENEVRDERAADPIATAAVDEDRAAARAAQHAENALEGGVVLGAAGDWDVDVLEPCRARDGRLVERPRLHRVAEIEHDPAARDTECGEVLGRGLTPAHHAGCDEAGVGHAGERPNGLCHV
jgi:hypothetical protein